MDPGQPKDSETIRQKRLARLDLAISEQHDRISKNKFKFQQILDSYFGSLSKFEISKVVYTCFNFVQKLEYRNDRSRNAKLENYAHIGPLNSKI